MCLLVAILTGPMFAGDMTYDQALKVLETRYNLVTPEKLEAAKDAVRAKYPKGGEECVTTLIGIWAGSEFSNEASLDLACELADKTTAPIITTAVAEKANRPDGNWPYRANRFFYRLLPSLWERLGRPDDLVEFALDSGRTIGHFPMNDAERDWFVLGELRRTRGAVDTNGSLSWANTLSSEAVPELARFATAELEVAESDPNILLGKRLHIAVDTLVARSAPQALPLVRLILQGLPDEPRTEMIRRKLDLAVLKLRFQNDKAALLKIVRTERQDTERLHFATWRYLLAGGSLSALHEALTANRVVLEDGPYAGTCIADAFLFAIFEERDSSWTRPDGTVVRRPPANILNASLKPFLLDGPQYESFLQRRTASAMTLNPEAMTRFMESFDYGSVIERAAP